MPTLRKTLLSLDNPCISSLEEMIRKQSKETLLNWCLGYARGFILPLYEERVPGEWKPQEALEAAYGWKRGEIKLPAARKKILGAHQAAREAEDSPVAQAAARAIGQAASTIHSKRHSLGFVFYAVAALSYHRLGVEASKEQYELQAREYCREIREALEKVIVEVEKKQRDT